VISLRWAGALALALLVPPTAVPAEETEPPSAAEVKARWMGRLDGRSFSVEVTLQVDYSGMQEERRIEVWRDDREGQERLMARFQAPPDLRGLGLLYLEQEGRTNDYFVYQPATGRVRRVPEVMAREDVYGVDLEYLGFGVAQIEPTNVESLERDHLDGEPVWRLEERAERDDARFDRRVVWLDPESFVPLRTEHTKDGRRTLVARTQAIDTVQGIATPRRVRFERPREGQVVEMRIEQVDYVSPIPEAFFTTMRLLRAR